MRFVLDPEHNVVPDFKRKLPGRGVWVQARAEYIKTAVKKQIFAKAFRKKVVTGENFLNHIESFLRDRILQKFALANKAGVVVCGFTKVSAALEKAAFEKNEIIALIHAKEAQPDGRHKLYKKLARMGKAGETSKKHFIQENEGQRAIKIIECFSTECLSPILGRENVMHSALKKSGIALQLLEDVLYLKRYQGMEPETGE